MSERNRDEETGKYADSYTDEDFLRAIESFGGAAGTADVAEVLGCSHSTAFVRLRKLEDGSKVDSREVGNSLLWSTIDE